MLMHGSHTLKITGLSPSMWGGDIRITWEGLSNHLISLCHALVEGGGISILEIFPAQFAYLPLFWLANENHCFNFHVFLDTVPAIQPVTYPYKPRKPSSMCLCCIHFVPHI